MARIEKDVFEFAWTEDELKYFMFETKAEPGLVQTAWYNDHLIGYMLYDRVPGCIELTVLAVARHYWRMGVGSQLLHSIPKLDNPRQIIVTEVREHNVIAQLFFQSLGFQLTAVHHEAYSRTDDDCYEFTRGIDGTSPAWPANRISQFS